MFWILGIAASHNGAVCLLHGDKVVVAIQEERLLRRKRARVHGAHAPLALKYCLDYAGIGVSDLDAVVICGQAALKDPDQSPRLNPAFLELRAEVPIHAISHHKGHALAAFATSGFTDAAVLVVDGMGSPWEDLTEDERAAAGSAQCEGWETVSLYDATGTVLTPIEKHFVKQGRWLGSQSESIVGNRAAAHHGMPAFGSLGGMYGAAAVQIFGDAMDGAGKVMGLAPYGRPTIPVSEFIEFGEDGSFRYQDRVCARFRHRDRWPLRREEYNNLAASVQAALETALVELVGRLRNRSRSDNLCYAGGVALNSVANERLVRESGFRNVYIQPAAEDSGTAIGAAYYGLWSLTGRNTGRALGHDATGRTYSFADVETALERTPCIDASVVGDPVGETVTALCAGRIVGFFDGRSELGPRALGQRSILCDPRRPATKEILNSRVKHRESFRPFAPVVLLDEAANWFEFERTPAESPFMLRVARFREDKQHLVPAVVHVDGTGRVQTVTERENGRLYAVVREFHRRTGVPLLLNTSFNVAGEPIVETPEDALWCLLCTGLDCCMLGEHLCTKQPSYKSLLDLVLTVEAEWLSSVQPVVAGRRLDFSPFQCLPFGAPLSAAASAEQALDRQAEGFGHGHARARVRTPWGRATHVLEHGVLAVLVHVDGRSTGHEVLAAVSRASDQPVSEEQFVHLVGQLRRAHILSLAEA